MNKDKNEIKEESQSEETAVKNNRISLDTFTANVAKRADVEQDKAKKFIHQMFTSIGDDLVNEDAVSIYRFGTFKKKWKEEREAINPQTNEKISVPAHYKVSFDPSSGLASEVNRKYRHLKPNVIDELLTLTGLTKVTPEYMAMVEHDEQMQARWQKAKKRAIWVLIILLLLLLLFFATIIFVPAYCYYQNNKVVNFCKQVNQMFGLESLSDRLRGEQQAKVIVQPVVFQDESNCLTIQEDVVSEDATDSVVVAPIIDPERAEEFMNSAKNNILMDRKIIADYEIKPGDTIFGIAESYWNNQYLWPDLYILNQKSVSDPDLIYVGDKIQVYEKIGDPENLTKQQREHIVHAYIGVYRVYRVYGEQDVALGTAQNKPELIVKGNKRIEDSCWTLYTAIRYDKNLLKTYKDAIIPEDIDRINLWITNMTKNGIIQPIN